MCSTLCLCVWWSPLAASRCSLARAPSASRCCQRLPGGDVNPGLLAGAGLAVLAAISSLGGGNGKKADQTAQKAKVDTMTIDVTTKLSLMSAQRMVSMWPAHGVSCTYILNTHWHMGLQAGAQRFGQAAKKAAPKFGTQPVGARVTLCTMKILQSLPAQYGNTVETCYPWGVLRTHPGALPLCRARSRCRRRRKTTRSALRGRPRLLSSPSPRACSGPRPAGAAACLAGSLVRRHITAMVHTLRSCSTSTTEQTALTFQPPHSSPIELF
jgi:hypothetical protein